MTLKIIGAGLGRTGTHSLKLGLETLGLGPCYHMESLKQNPADIDYWEGLALTGQARMGHLFQYYNSGVDFPVFAFYPRLLRHYPDALVILTIRPAEEWYESASRTILRDDRDKFDRWKMTLGYPFSPRLRKLGEVYRFAENFWKNHIGTPTTDKSKAMAFYECWNREVKNRVPAEKLLVFDCKEGWGPLCEFLQTPIPEKPFPVTNTREVFHERSKYYLQAVGILNGQKKWTISLKKHIFA